MTGLPPAPRGPVVCVGETMAALAPEPLGPLAGAELLRVDVAGAESNVAAFLAAHGVTARWVSAVGADPFGERVRTVLAARGVDVTAVRTDPDRPTGVLLKDPGPHGTRVHYHRRESAASALGPDVLTAPAFTGAALVHLTGITPALSDRCRALAEHVLAPGRPWPVSFDVNHRPALWPDRTTAATTLLALARRADLVLVGLDEAQALWDGIASPSDVRELLPEPGILVVKDAAGAATAFTGTETVSVPALSVEVAEPVGAGDAFAAGFLAGTLRGEPPSRALRLGHLTAAAALRTAADYGPLPPPEHLSALLSASAHTWRTTHLPRNGSGPQVVGTRPHEHGESPKNNDQYSS